MQQTKDTVPAILDPRDGVWRKSSGRSHDSSGTHQPRESLSYDPQSGSCNKRDWCHQSLIRAYQITRPKDFICGQEIGVSSFDDSKILFKLTLMNKVNVGDPKERCSQGNRWRECPEGKCSGGKCLRKSCVCVCVSCLCVCVSYLMMTYHPE